MKAVSSRTTVVAQEGLLTRSQLATELEVSDQLIAIWERDGLPVLKIGQQRLYDIKHVAAWIRKTGSKK